MKPFFDSMHAGHKEPASQGHWTDEGKANTLKHIMEGWNGVSTTSATPIQLVLGYVFSCVRTVQSC